MNGPVRLSPTACSPKLIVLAWTKEYFLAYGASPSLSEIAAGTGMSKFSVRERLIALEQDGELVYVRGVKRGIVLHNPADMLSRTEILLRAKELGLHVGPPLTNPELPLPSGLDDIPGLGDDGGNGDGDIATMVPTTDKHGEDYLRSSGIPQAQWPLIRAYARGDLGSRAGGMSTSMLPVIQAAINYDPSASGTNFPARVKMQSDLASGDPKSAGGQLQAFERMLLHGSEVLDKSQALGNFHSGLAAPLNYLMAAGRGLEQTLPQNGFNEAVRNYAPEAQKAISGVAGGEGERVGRQAAFSAAMSPEAVTGGLQADARQAMDAMQAVNDRYHRLMGRDITDALSPAAKAAYDKIMAGGFDKAGTPMRPAEGWTPISGPGAGAAPGGGMPAAPANPLLGGPSPDAISLATGTTRNERVRTPEMTAVAAMAGAGASAAQIRAYLQQKNIDPSTVSGIDEAVAFHRQHPNVKLDAYQDRLVPNSPLSRIAATPAATALTQGVDAAGMGLLDEGAGALNSLVTGAPLADTIAAADRAKRLQAETNPGAALAGSLAGNFLTGAAASGLAAKIGLGHIPGILGDMAYGAAYGAGSQNDDRAAGALTGAAGAAAGNYLGGKALGMFGRGLRGVADPAVRYLADAGVPMTGGQMLGGVTKAIEDKATSLPFVGDAIKARRAEGYRAFNQRAFDEAAAPVGGTMPGIGDIGLGNLNGATSDAYDRALNGVRVNGNDPLFINDMQAVVNHAKTLPEPMKSNAEKTLNFRVGQAFDNNGSLSGRDFQQAVRGLRMDASSFRDKPWGHDFGHVATGTQDALELMLGRQSPGTMPAYDAANEAFRHQAVLTDALKAAQNQIDDNGDVLFSPAQLNRASVNGTVAYGGKLAAMTGDRPFAQLAQAGQQVLPSKIPDSGTAGRAALALIPATLAGSAAGGGAGYASGDAGAGSGIGAAAGLAAGLLNTRAGQKALAKVLLDRPDWLRNFGKLTVDNAPTYGGMFGARIGAAAPLLLGSQ